MEKQLPHQRKKPRPALRRVARVLSSGESGWITRQPDRPIVTNYRSNKSMSCDVWLQALFRQGSPNPVSSVFNRSK